MSEEGQNAFQMLVSEKINY